MMNGRIRFIVRETVLFGLLIAILAGGLWLDSLFDQVPSMVSELYLKEAH